MNYTEEFEKFFSTTPDSEGENLAVTAAFKIMASVALLKDVVDAQKELELDKVEVEGMIISMQMLTATAACITKRLKDKKYGSNKTNN